MVQIRILSNMRTYLSIPREMVTEQIPYCDMNMNEIIFNVGWEKKIVDVPTKGHSVILQIIKMCLNYNIDKRPKFKEITEKLQESLKELSKKKVICFYYLWF